MGRTAGPDELTGRPAPRGADEDLDVAQITDLPRVDHVDDPVHHAEPVVARHGMRGDPWVVGKPPPGLLVELDVDDEIEGTAATAPIGGRSGVGPGSRWPGWHVELLAQGQ
jgi:hypothetical protein